MYKWLRWCFVCCHLLVLPFLVAFGKELPSIAHFSALVSPIKISWKEVQWHSPTHAVVPLLLTIGKQWKIYGPPSQKDTLKNPPKITWSASANVISVRPVWPQPVPYKEYGQNIHVYFSNVIIPLDVMLQERTPTRLEVTIEGLACSMVCQPVKKTLSLQLTPPAFPWTHWLKMWAMAFLGGLILNFMPCVFPVLGLKLKGFTKSSPEFFRKMCFFTLTGIVSGFWILSAIIIFFKVFFQVHLGWGMQLHNPYFVTVLSLIMIACAYSLLGMFHVHTPQWVHKSVSLIWNPSLESFLWGLLGVFLATPCSAPLLGAALGFALTGNAAEIFLFYTAIAFGFGFPYVLGLFFSIGRFLPRPGPWMSKVEYIMGLLFLISAVWLIGWPLSAFFSQTLRYVSFVFLAVWIAIPLLYPMARRMKKKKWLFYRMPILMGVVFFFFPFLPSAHVESVSMQDGEIHWIAWDEDKLKKILQGNRMVFLDVTGAGCALCMFNKRVFALPRIQRLLASPNVVCMRADYSRGSPKILNFLKRYGRVAIPFNVILHKDYLKGIILSEYLTENEVLKAFKMIKKMALTK